MRQILLIAYVKDTQTIISYRATQQPPIPQTESQHNSFKVFCSDKFYHNTSEVNSIVETLE